MMKITPRLPESMRCYKMHGLGNDYIYFLDTELPVGVDLSVLARVVSDRHYGIGGDGIVLVGKSDVADVSMRIWNIDGTEAQMCGNASRCVALLVRKLNLCDKDDITLSTLSGIKQLHINRDDSGHIDSVTVDMGKPIFDAERIPVDPALLKGDPAVFVAFTPNGHLEFVPLSMGNPHGVTFVDAAQLDVLPESCGPFMERHPAWPEKANIEFANVTDRRNIRMRVWERGSGLTLACGTGACATAVAAMMTGRTDRRVNVHLPGGVLTIEWSEADNHVRLTGDATFVADMTYFPPSSKAVS